MAETIGSLVDKITIAELKRFHMQEQVDRADATPEHRQICRQRVKVITRQRDDLTEELTQLIALWAKGKWEPRVYRQFKMYNDPKYKLKPTAVHVR